MHFMKQQILLTCPELKTILFEIRFWEFSDRCELLCSLLIVKFEGIVIFLRYVNDICELWKSMSLDQRLNRCSSCFDLVTSFHRFLIVSISLFFYALTLNLQLVLIIIVRCNFRTLRNTLFFYKNKFIKTRALILARKLRTS